MAEADLLFGDATADVSVDDDTRANGNAESSASDSDTEHSPEPAPAKTQRTPRSKPTQAAKMAVGSSRRKQLAGGNRPKTMSLHDRKKAAVEARNKATLAANKKAMQKGAGMKGKVKGKAVPTVTDVVKRKVCFNVSARRAIVSAMKAPDVFLIPQAPVKRLVNEVVEQACDALGLDGGFRVNAKARYLLHYALEDYVRKELSKANMAAMQADRMTLYVEDMHRVKEIEQNHRDGFVYMNRVGWSKLKNGKESSVAEVD